MLGAQRLIQVGSSLSADGVHPELQLSLYQNAYRPARNILGCLRQLASRISTPVGSNFGTFRDSASHI